MLIVRTREEIENVEPAALRQLIEVRQEEITADQCEGDPASSLVVIERQDRDEDLRARLGISVFENRFSGTAFGEPDFTPSFELIEEHDCCTELVFVLGDDGGGAVVFIPDGVEFDLRLPALRERYAIRQQGT